jgi:hypothetical protein
MVKPAVQKKKSEAGQAVLLVIAAMSIFLLGAVGLAVDGSHLYAQRQAAQAAADASAVAGMMSIFDGTNTFTSDYSCTTSDGTSPCWFARQSGFKTAATDTDTVSVELDPAGVTVASLDPGAPHLLRVTVTRPVSMTLTKFVGLSSFDVKASATAAIVDVISPVPIVITHPTMAGALNLNGSNNITITGGPQRSIQVNSNGTNPAGNAYSAPGSGLIDLTGAGPNGTGGDFGTFGGPNGARTCTPVCNINRVEPGSSGHYLDRSSPVQDPLAGVAEPSTTGLTARSPNGQACSVLGHCTGNCPVSQFGAGSPPPTCTEYLPGIYSSLDLTLVPSAFFDPGIYYIQAGGFTLKNNTVQMCQTCAADATTVNGALIYDAGATSTSTATGGFTIGTNAYAKLVGAGVSTSNTTAAPTSPYYGILFFEKREADAHTPPNKQHHIGAGNGCFSIIGTIYITNTLGIMNGDATHYQSVEYNGTPCTGVANVGEIIVSQLTEKGTAGINMQLFPNGFLTVRQVALVQ